MLSKEGNVIDRREMLRIKAKTLADEARIIRGEERRARGSMREEMRVHRISVVRDEARATYLAYGLVKGKTLDKIEVSKTRTEALWKKVRGMIEKYGPVDKSLKSTLLESCKE